MWMRRRITETRRIEEKKNNERVSGEIQERRQLTESITEIKIELIGHIVRHNDFINIIFEEKNQEKKPKIENKILRRVTRFD